MADKEAEAVEWKTLQFQPFHTIADLTFWRELGRRKLEEYKLSDETVPLYATYEPSRSVHLPVRPSERLC